MDTDRAILADLATALTAGASRLGSVLDIAVRACAELVGDGALIRLADDAGILRVAGVHHPDPATQELVRASLSAHGQHVSQGISGIVRRTGRPLAIDLSPRGILRRSYASLRPLIVELDIHSVVVVPLLADGHYLGYLATFRTTGSQPLDAAARALTADIAARVALAVAVAQSVERLRESEALYRSIVETAAEGIARTDLSGTLVFANAQLARILGTEVADLVGQPVTRFLPPGDPPRFPVPPGGGARERVMVRGDGHEIWVQVSTAPTVGRGGEITGALSLVTDVTAQKRARQLEQQLDQMRRLESLGQLAGGVAHDVNNLLGVIGGFAELLRDEPDDATRRQAAGHIAAAVHKGAAITSQLLTFGRGRPQAGRGCDLASVCAEAEPLLSQAAGNLVALTVHTPGQPVPVSMDAGQVEQILVNLVVNARDAMPTGGQLRVACDTADDAPHPVPPGRHARLSVTDTGHGMDESTRERVFEPFFTTKPIGQGTGLGLAGVSGMVRAAHGHVRLDSALGVGTTVTIYLPAAAVDAAVPAQPRPPAAPAAAQVLVVEDNPTMAELIERLLGASPFRATVVTQPAEALARLAAGLRPEVLLSDIVMPTMTGPEMAAAARFHVPGLRVVYMSGYPAGALELSGRFEADAPVLEKPFRRQDLLGALGTAARAARAAPAAEDRQPVR